MLLQDKILIQEVGNKVQLVVMHVLQILQVAGKDVTGRTLRVSKYMY